MIDDFKPIEGHVCDLCLTHQATRVVNNGVFCRDCFFEILELKKPRRVRGYNRDRHGIIRVPKEYIGRVVIVDLAKPPYS